MPEQTSSQPWEDEVLTADNAFFTALVEGDGQALDRALADRFVLVGVNDGAVVPREALVPLVDQGRLRFDTIQADGSEVLLRRYGSTAIVVGRTKLHGSFDGAPFSAKSRYTHVFVEDQGRWRLASSQGTPIVGDEPGADRPSTGL
jgi:ketosteroid isomerase-like protein